MSGWTWLGKRLLARLAATGMLALVLTAGSAFASEVSGNVSQVEVLNSPNSPQLLVQMNGVNVNYLAQQYTPGCGLQPTNMETIKLFQSLATSALLAGKNVVLYYNTCNGSNWLYDIVLQR